MAYVIRESIKSVRYLFEECGDYRSERLPLMKSVFPVILLLSAYLYFVKVIGPKFMKDRKAYDLKIFMIFYNLIQVILNSLLFINAYLYSYYLPDFKFRCQNVSLGDDETSNMQVKLHYCYFLLKLLDMFDTVIFVLRKKTNQVSFLHVYHHVVIAFAAWSTVKFAPGGHGCLLGILNSLVHAIMYSYYLITVYNKDARNWIQWKKRLTLLQIVQFIIFIIHFGGPLIFPVEGCNYAKIILWLGFGNNIFMVFMFSDFYVRTYLKKKNL